MRVVSWLKLVALTFVLTATLQVVRADWPQWRGAARDGRTNELTMPAVWPKTLKEEWKIPVGVGHASPVVALGQVFVFVRQDDTDEVAMALDARTGKLIWKSGYKVDYEMNEAARGHGKGPKSTPVVAGERVYTLGITGVLSCYNAHSGEIIWQKYFNKEFPTTSPLYGTAMSPLVTDGLVIAHVGGHDKGALTAFNAETGKVVWSYAGDGPAYASPIVVTLAGVRQLVTFTQKQLVGVDLKNGKLLWQLPAKTEYDTNSVTPVVYKDLLIFAREGQGLTAVRVVKQGAQFTTQEVWRNAENELYMNTPVVAGNLLYGLSMRKRGQFFCLDADTGKTLWQGPGRQAENAALINAGKVLLALTTESTLFVIQPNAKELTSVAQYQVANSPVWAHPAIMGERIIVKDETMLTSFVLKN